MPRRPKQPPVVCEYFTWRVFRRNGVYYADGRGGTHDLGKHSLDTRDREEALANLRQLDRFKAVELGLANPTTDTRGSELPIADGWQRFLEYCRRPEVLGGVSLNTQKRYRAVRDKHAKFCGRQGIQSWSEVDKSHTEQYGTWLSRKKYADRSIYLEMMLIGTVVKWMIREKLLPETCRFQLSLRRPEGTETYCYSREEVTVMIEHCRSRSDLGWMADVIIALACTGLRISELASLRLSDVDLESNTISLTDERGSSRRKKAGAVRTTKGRRGRTLPIHPHLRDVVSRLARHADGRLLHGPRGGKLKPDTVRNVLIREVLAPLKQKFPTPDGEIGFEHGRLHSFRHYFVSQAFVCGASEGEIKEWVGHRDSKMVEHYRHLRDEDSQRRMRQIDFLGTNGKPSRGAEPPHRSQKE